MLSKYTDFEGFALNVWSPSDNDNDDPLHWDWKLALYADRSTGIDTSNYLPLEPSPDQIRRYLELSQDADWWVSDNDADFHYILWGTHA
jgi:hypothetical protein